MCQVCLPTRLPCFWTDAKQVLWPAGFGDTIKFVGGVNKPKLVQCLDSAGTSHRQVHHNLPYTGMVASAEHVLPSTALSNERDPHVCWEQSPPVDACTPLVQLVKSGADDLRQDAVMQQLFGLVNSFLRASAPTRQRSLQIAVYKVGMPRAGQELGCSVRPHSLPSGTGPSGMACRAGPQVCRIWLSCAAVHLLMSSSQAYTRAPHRAALHVARWCPSRPRRVCCSG